MEALLTRCDAVWNAHGLTPLRVRHACASDLHAAGVSLKVRSAILGHSSSSSSSMTEDRYTHRMPDDVRGPPRRPSPASSGDEDDNLK